MPRPQKYSDTDISNAIQSLVAKGEPVNPTRIRAALGGGSATRIKAVLERRLAEAEAGSSPSLVPETLHRIAREEAAKASEQVTGLVNRCWSIAHHEAMATLQVDHPDHNEKISRLEADLAAVEGRCLRAEQERDQAVAELEAVRKKRDELERECSGLTEALRNAESDLRALKTTIRHFENSQRRDRDEVSALQRRVEELLVELTTLKALAAKGGSAG